MGNTTPSRILMIIAIIFAIPGVFVVMIDGCIYSFLYIHRTVSFAKSEVRLALEEPDELYKDSKEREYKRGYKDAVKKYGDPYWIMDHGDEKWLRDELFDEIILKKPTK